MTLKNLTMTFELGRMRTWRLPAFSALLMLFRASFRTEVLTILTAVDPTVDWPREVGDSQVEEGEDLRYLHEDLC